MRKIGRVNFFWAREAREIFRARGRVGASIFFLAREAREIFRAREARRARGRVGAWARRRVGRVI